MANYWKNFDSYPWLTNTPRLLLVNPKRKKGKSTMAKRRHKRRANPVANPRRRRRSNPLAVNRRRRRRNPPNGEAGGLDVLGVKFPALQSIAYGTVGFLGPPIIEGYIGPMLPAGITTNQGGRYVVKIGSVVGLAWLTDAMAGRQAALKVAMGGGIYLAASLVNDFMPQMFGTAAQPRAAYYPRLAAQPLLGDYGRSANMTVAAPARLQPQSRY
jgi:hypothetical protein